MALSPEEPVNLSRTLTVPEPTQVQPTVWVRARQGPRLADLIRQPGTTLVAGDADALDVLGSAYAAGDGDPRTAWTAPQRVVQHRTPPSLKLTLPAPAEVAALRITPSRTEPPAHPTMVAVDLGNGPQTRRLTGDSGTQTIRLAPHRTDTIEVSLLNWNDIIDRTSLGFDQLKPPGLAEVTALDARGNPIAAADAQRNRARTVDLPCGQGPIIGVAGQFVPTAVTTTVGALLDGEPIPARPCRTDPIALPAGEQELLISPGATFVVDGVQLRTKSARDITPAPTSPVDTGAWEADRREVTVPAGQRDRVLVVPESVNPGWRAHGPGGDMLTPVVVNGWQQGWVVPADTDGTVTLSFRSNTLYRAGLIVGLALLPVLALLALLPARRHRDDEPARPWQPPATLAAAGALAVGAVVSGWAGVVVVGGMLGLGYLLRRRQRVWDRLTLGVSAAGLTLAGLVLAQHPWRSVDGYVGHSPGVQLLALLSVAALAASAVSFTARSAPR